MPYYPDTESADYEQLVSRTAYFRRQANRSCGACGLRGGAHLAACPEDVAHLYEEEQKEEEQE